MDEKQLHDRVIYLHRNPKTLIVFYVGIGSRKRPYEFRRRNKKWVKYVLEYGNPIVDVLLVKLTMAECLFLEKKLIDSIGVVNLTNLTCGGQGSLGRVTSDETRKKMSEVRKKNEKSYQTTEYRRKMSEIKTGVKHTTESKDKISITHKGRKRPDGLLDYVRSFRKPMSDEKKEAVSKRFREIVRTDEWRRKIGEANKKRKGIKFRKKTEII